MDANGNITGKNVWIEQVKGVKVGDKVLGGQLGSVNIMAQDLANRDTYLYNRIQENEPSTNIFGSNYLIDTIYQNTSNRKIMVTAIIDGGNDIFGFAAHVGISSESILSKGSDRDANGRDANTCYAYEYHVSDGRYPDVTTLIFIVPPAYYFKMTGNAEIIRSISWEL